MAQYTRRTVLGSAVIGLAGVAGCSSGGVGPGADTEGSTDTVVQSSFFVFGDVAAQVTGDTARAETLVPVGQHGHGWEPGPRIRQEIEAADVFVYGMDGFQPWADDVSRDLREDGADVVSVAAVEGVDLLERDHDDGHDAEDDGDHEGGQNEDHEGGHDDHDGVHEEDDTDHHDDVRDGHDHGSGVDPHFWLDPLRVKTAVSNVEEALASVDEANAERYAENASAYQERLDSLHESFASTLSDAAGAVVLVAGHDAFQYLEDAYGVKFVSLTGVSPDDRPTPRDIERAQEVVDEHDLRYVCADPLESQRAAEELVAETNAEAVLPLTSIPGRRESWADDGWGYVDVMEAVNLATLEQVVADR